MLTRITTEFFEDLLLPNIEPADAWGLGEEQGLFFTTCESFYTLARFNGGLRTLCGVAAFGMYFLGVSEHEANVLQQQFEDFKGHDGSRDRNIAPSRVFSLCGKEW